MRSYFILFLLVAICTASYSQNSSDNGVYYESAPQEKIGIFSNPTKTKPAIVRDNISSNGARFVWSSSRYNKIPSSYKDPSFRVQIEGIKIKDDAPTYNIVFSLNSVDDPLTVNKDSPIMIKLGDDSIINLKSLYESRDIVGNMHQLTYSSYKTYYINVFASIDEETIYQLKKGFKKIRFEVNSNIYDVIQDKDNISQFIIDSYNLVKNKLITKRDFKDNF